MKATTAEKLGGIVRLKWSSIVRPGRPTNCLHRARLCVCVHACMCAYMRARVCMFVAFVWCIGKNGQPHMIVWKSWLNQQFDILPSLAPMQITDRDLWLQHIIVTLLEDVTHGVVISAAKLSSPRQHMIFLDCNPLFPHQMFENVLEGAFKHWEGSRMPDKIS